MSFIQLTRSQHLFAYANILSDAGESIERLLETSGLPNDCLENPRTLVPTSALWKFRELASIRTDLPNISMNALESLEFFALGSITNVVLSKPTLVRMVQAFEALVIAESSTPSISVQLRSDGSVLFTDHLALTQTQGKWHAELYILLWVVKIVQLVQPGWVPAEIFFISEANPRRVKAIESLGAKPHFNHSCTAVEIPAKLVALPYTGRQSVPDVHPGGAKVRSPPVPPSDLAGSVKAMILSYSCKEWLTASEASEIAGVSLRTFQRRLATEAASYSKLLEEVRIELAADLLLSTDESIAEVARHLGYENQANFTRAFRRWAGVPPTFFRFQRQCSRSLD